MNTSTIAKREQVGANSPFARTVGAELRRIRQQKGLTQAQLAGPFTSAFISAVELGHVVPSLPALALLLDRLETPLSDFFSGVKWALDTM